MLVEDRLTGYLHEVPDPVPQMHGLSNVAYDGLGNPVGLFPGIGQLIQGLLPGTAAAASPAAQPIQAAGSALPGAFGQDLRRFFPPPPHIPPGWMRPPLPYTGLG